MGASLLPKFAFDTLKEAELFYRENGSFDNKALENLHCLFGEKFVLATELLEKSRIIQYQIEDQTRSVFKIIMHKEQYTIYSDINFCTCKNFQYQVLESRNHLTCKHILAVKLGRIVGQIKTEPVTGSQFVEFLNEQLNAIEENDNSE